MKKGVPTLQTAMLVTENFWLLTRFLHRTYVLNIIRCYSLVVLVYGTFSYDYYVQSFLVSAILEGYKEFIKHERTLSAFPKAGSSVPFFKEQWDTWHIMEKVFEVNSPKWGPQRLPLTVSSNCFGVNAHLHLLYLGKVLEHISK